VVADMAVIELPRQLPFPNHCPECQGSWVDSLWEWDRSKSFPNLYSGVVYCEKMHGLRQQLTKQQSLVFLEAMEGIPPKDIARHADVPKGLSARLPVPPAGGWGDLSNLDPAVVFEQAQATLHGVESIDPTE
jgi:hypothetical protein